MQKDVERVEFDSSFLVYGGFTMGDADEWRRRRSRVEMENLSLDTSRDLLQRFMGISEKSELEIVEDINEDELNLGLSLGGRFGVDKSSSNLLVRSSSIAACLPTVRDDDAVAVSSSLSQSVSCNPSLVRTSSLPVETELEWRKRKELQSLRRMEAKRRRSEKVQRNLRGEKCMEDENRGTDQMNLRGGNNNNNKKKLEKEQFLATARKFGCKLPTLAALGADDMAMAKGKESYLQEKKKPASQGSMESQGGCSSSISELESKPAQGIGKSFMSLTCMYILIYLFIICYFVTIVYYQLLRVENQIELEFCY